MLVMTYCARVNGINALTATLFLGSQIDACGMCRLPSDNSTLTCLDCFGVPKGNAAIDQCGVCNGTGTSCLDCAGVPFGVNRTDECGDCRDPEDEGPGGFSRACEDCFGVPNGPAQLDRCDVCDGDGTSCLLTRDIIILAVIGTILLLLLCCGLWLVFLRRDMEEDDNDTPAGVGARVRMGRDRTSKGADVTYATSGGRGTTRGLTRRRAAAGPKDVSTAIADMFGAGTTERSPLLERD